MYLFDIDTNFVQCFYVALRQCTYFHDYILDFWLNTSIRVTNGAVPLQKKSNKLLMHKGLANTLLCLWFLYCLQSTWGTPRLGFVHSNYLCSHLLLLQHHQCPPSFYLATVITVMREGQTWV